jgi:NADPH-dependent curcumin reductase CurA
MCSLKPAVNSAEAFRTVGRQFIIRQQQAMWVVLLSYCLYAACSPPTALLMLEAIVQLQPGDVVVQNGATSAVGQVGCGAAGTSPAALSVWGSSWHVLQASS